MTLNNCIVFDIDGTLANCSHRVHHVNGKKKDWPAFFAGIPDDPPIEQMILLNHTLHRTDMVFLCTGRSEDEREMTEAWLTKYNVVYDKMFMRPAKDYRPDHVVKREMLEAIRLEGYNPHIVFDDRQSVVDMWRKEGLYVLQADPKPSHTDHHSYKFHASIKHPLTILVGPSGAGKSTWIAEYKDEYPSNVISSDDLRQMFTGDFGDQSANLRVFEAMHEIADTKLKLGLPVTLDATHLRNADRVKAAKLVPADVPILYKVINRPLKDKIKDAGWRASVSVKGKPLVEFHDQVFKSNIKAILAGDDLPNVTVDTELLK